MAQAQECADGVGAMPVGFDERAFLLQGAVLPKGMHACAVNNLPTHLVGHLRTAVLRALWGSGRRFRCKEIVLSLFVRGHRLDPGQVMTYSALTTLHKMLCTRPTLHTLLSETWRATVRRRTATGPISRVRNVLRQLNWEWPDLHTVITDEGLALNLPTLEQGTWQHEVREGLRRAQWRCAAQRRRDMKGIEFGIDRVATMALLAANKLEDYSKGILRSIISGAV